MTSMVSVTGRMIGGRHVDGTTTEIVGAAALTGEQVINAVGDNLGAVRDLMIDVASGRVLYAVLEFAGHRGAGDKLFAVPWLALTMDADNRCFILNVDKRRLKDAPGFDRECWPTTTHAEWVDEVHRFYDAEPFWHYHA